MQILHDIHTHTTLSRCCYDPEATVGNYVRRAAELGHKIFGLSNHLWDEKVPGASSWYKNQMISYGLQERDCIPADTCGVKVLTGAETEYFYATDTLGMLAETAKQFDYILVPHSHVHFRNTVMPDNADTRAIKEIFTERIASALPELSTAQVAKMANALGYAEMDAMAADGVFFPPTVIMEEYCAKSLLDSFMALMSNSEFIKLAAAVPTSIAHPFTPCGFSKETIRKILALLPEDKLTECFKTAKSLGVAMEINTASYAFPDNDYADDPTVRVMKIAKAAGCRFTFGTDTHSLKGLDTIRRGDILSATIGIEESDLAQLIG